jgi:hypothetical protein
MLSLASNISSIQAVEAKYSASFDGIDDFIDTGQTFQSTFRGDFTFSLWVKPSDGISGLQFLCGSDAGGSNSIIRIRIQNGDIEFEIEANGNFSDFLTNDQVFTDGAQDSWTHILISFKNNGGTNNPTCNIHINGSAPVTLDTPNIVNNVTGNDLSALSISSNRPLLIGARFQGNNFEGGIDEFAIFSNDLDTNNAAAIYNGGSPLNLTFDQGNYNNSSNLVAYYKMGDGFFDDKANGIVHDQDNPGFGNNLVVNGTFSADSNWTKTENESTTHPGTFSSVTINNSSSGVAELTIVNGAYAKLTQAVTYTSGSTYKLTAIVNGTAGFKMRFRDDTGGSGGLSTLADREVLMTGGPQNVVKYFVANSNSDELAIERETSSGSYTFTVDNVSLQKLNGNPGITSGGTIFSSDTPTP